MSTLNNEEINEKILKNQLITKEFDRERIKEACYEARTSNIFYEITEVEAKKTVIKDDDIYILRPNNQVVCVTKEYFEIPLDIIARILLIGHYFSLGIAPVNTYADPGFKGKLGIVLTNTSKNYLIIKPNEPIAKIEFSTITTACNEGYVGQHGGDVTVWPFRKDLIADIKLLNSKNIDPESDCELVAIYGPTLKNTIIEARISRKYFIFSTLFSTIIPLFLIWGINEKWNMNSPLINAIICILTGLFSNYIFFIINNRSNYYIK